MRPDYLALKAELAGPAYAGTDDDQAATLLNAPGAAVPGSVPQHQLLMWGSETGALVPIAAAMAAGDAPGASPEARGLGAICHAVDYLLSGGSIGFDCGSPANRAGLAAFVAKGICTQAQADDLVARGSTPGPSRAVTTFGVPATAKDVAHARSLS